MSKFKLLALESAYDVLVEAPAANNAQPVKQPQPQSDAYVIKASGHKMRQFAGQDFYFLDFETQQNGKKLPMFAAEQYKNVAKKFGSEKEAQQTINQIYQEAPEYKNIYQSITTEPTSGSVNINSEQTTYEPEEDNMENQNEKPSAWSKFKSDLSNIKDQAKQSLSNATDKFSNVFGKNDQPAEDNSAFIQAIDEQANNLRTYFNDIHSFTDQVVEEHNRYNSTHQNTADPNATFYFDSCQEALQNAEASIGYVMRVLPQLKQLNNPNAQASEKTINALKQQYDVLNKFLSSER